MNKRKILPYLISAGEIVLCFLSVGAVIYFFLFLAAWMRETTAANLPPRPVTPADTGPVDDETAVRQALLDLLEGYYYEPDILDKLPQLRSLNARQIAMELNAYETAGKLPPYVRPNYVFTTEEYKKLQDHFEGNPKAVGPGTVGMLSPDGEAYMVLRTVPGSPADRAGLKKGDKIIEVDGQPIAGQPFHKVIGAIRGEAGVPTTFRVSRQGSADFTVSIQRELLEFSHVYHDMIGETIGFLRISDNWPSAVPDGERAIESLKARGAAALVFDLRNNMGGVVDVAVDIARFFLPSGAAILTTETRGEEKRVHFSTGDALWNGPMVTLINRQTMASAEALAAALKEHQRSVLMGGRTFGKGSLQSIFALQGPYVAKVTTGRLYSPLGESFQGLGVNPDVEVEDPSDIDSVVRFAPDTIADDPQLQAAVEYLTEKDEG